jgi:hypothetical protein
LDLNQTVDRLATDFLLIATAAGTASLFWREKKRE